VFFFLSKTLDALLSPLSWSVVLLAIGLSGDEAQKRRRWIGALGLAALLIFSFEPFANALQRAVERGAARTYRDDLTYDAVILLGGVVERAAMSNPPAYNDSIERVLVAYDLLAT
jgi:uncharacterized SAM-binding protein YcdF (DUF218 family)